VIFIIGSEGVGIPRKKSSKVQQSLFQCSKTWNKYNATRFRNSDFGVVLQVIDFVREEEEEVV
jgi:hypothetical protein